MKKAFFMLSLVALTSCGPAFVPSPTTKAVSVSDVTGLWQYNDDYHKFKIRIRFNPGGTYTKAVPWMLSVTNTGTWSLAGANLTVNDALVDIASGKPTTNDVHWYMIDDPAGGTNLLIYGGDIFTDDPDQGEAFEFLGK